MKTFYLAVLLLGMSGCGTLGAVADAVEVADRLEDYEDAAQTSADELERKLELAQGALDAYAPIIAASGEDVQEAYAKVQELLSQGQGYLTEGRELLAESTQLHRESMAQATDPETGETDWVEYALLMLLGGGGLLTERKKTQKERDRVHERVDTEKNKRKQLEEALARLQHQMELEQARRETPPTS